VFNTSDSFKSTFFDPKNGVFWGGPRGVPFSRFFLHFFPKLSKNFVSRFLLNARSLWTLLCRCNWVTLECYLHPWLTFDYTHFTPSLNARVPSPVHLSRSSFDSGNQKQRPTRLLLIFGPLAQVTLMHASSALQLTLGHAQPGDVPLLHFQYRSLPVVLDHTSFAFEPSMLATSFLLPLSHERSSLGW
jgi:hypothetical protein